MSNVRRRLVALALVAVALVVGLLWWVGKHATSTPTAPHGASRTGVPRGSADPATGAPRWFGQTGVGGRRIAGIVVGDDGAPLAGVTVRLASRHTVAGLARAPKKLTDAAGRFDLGAQPASEYVVTAELPKLTGALLRVDLRDPVATPPPDQLRLVMHACDASIHGTIYDTAGGAIAGALVARQTSWVATQVGVEADDKGYYELCLPPGGAGVMVTADGYAAITETISVYGRSRRDFQLAPGATVIGRVVRADDRSAIEGALVTLWPADPRREAPQWTASDADGRFHFDAVAPGRHQITAEAERLATRDPIDVTAEVGAPATEVTCELGAAVMVSGRVIERGTGKPVPGETVWLYARDASRFNPSRSVSAITQPDGTFTIDPVVSGEYMASVQLYRAQDRRQQAFTVAATDVTGIVIEVSPAASIAGRVLYGGKPVDDARVKAGDAGFATSDAEGRFLLRGLDAGTVALYAESHRVGAFAHGPSVTLGEAEHKTGVDIELDLSGSIAGVVVDQNEAPVGGVFLSFSLLHGRDFGAATTADDGTFTARALSGGGDYLCEVRERDQSPLVYPPATGKRHPPITVKDGQAHVTGARIKIRYERLAIAGRVTDGAGNPVADAAISAMPREAGWFRVPSTTTDQAGAFTIHDLPAGSYTVQATAAHGEARADNIAAGRNDVALRLLEPGGIDGTLSGFTATPLVVAFGFDDRSSRTLATVSGSKFQLRNLPAGRYRVMATAGGDRVSAVVEVAPGKIETVTLARPETGIVAGTVVDAKTHAPVTGLHCFASLARQDENFDLGPRTQSTSDASGAFRIEGAPAGVDVIRCYGKAGNGSVQTTVTAGQTTRVDVASTPSDAEPARGHAGMTLEDQFGEVLVDSVEAGGPAARAGIAVGDGLVSIDGSPIDHIRSRMALELIEAHTGSDLKLGLERNDKQLAVTLKVDPAPASTP